MSAGTGNALAARDLAAGYGSRTLWSGADFEVPEGSFTAVLGPNGAGKSTLVKLMLGLVPPRAGDLQVLGAPPRRGNPRIGYIPQSLAFDPEFSVRGRDFVGLGLDGHRWGLPLPSGAGARAAAVDAAISSVGAEGYA
ncbi:MAG TPA: ATP-binding cassette domain-containing protein, partial [Candidatus Dormibacteraeota bacterium]